jgi:hypothetical protein
MFQPSANLRAGTPAGRGRVMIDYRRNDRDLILNAKCDVLSAQRNYERGV